MKLTLTGRHLEITPHLRQHVEAKVEKLEHLTEHMIEGGIVLFRDHVNDVAEGKIHISHTILTARAEATDMYAAVNELVDRLEVQLRRHFDKIHSRKRLPPETNGQ
jgi:putative sigma-54 modulation protein